MAQSIADLSSRDLRRAAALKEKIDSLQSELARLFGGTNAKTGKTRGRRRKMSAEGKARIAEAQRRRWAKVRRQAAK